MNEAGKTVILRPFWFTIFRKHSQAGENGSGWHLQRTALTFKRTNEISVA